MTKAIITTECTLHSIYKFTNSDFSCEIGYNFQIPAPNNKSLLLISKKKLCSALLQYKCAKRSEKTLGTAFHIKKNYFANPKQTKKPHMLKLGYYNYHHLCQSACHLHLSHCLCLSCCHSQSACQSDLLSICHCL